jgi:hypothetical protein
MAFIIPRARLVRSVRPHIPARPTRPIRSTWAWALPLLLMLVALMVPVVASLSLRAWLFMPD